MTTALVKFENSTIQELNRRLANQQYHFKSYDDLRNVDSSCRHYVTTIAEHVITDYLETTRGDIIDQLITEFNMQNVSPYLKIKLVQIRSALIEKYISA